MPDLRSKPKLAGKAKPRKREMGTHLYLVRDDRSSVHPKYERLVRVKLVDCGRRGEIGGRLTQVGE